MNIFTYRKGMVQDRKAQSAVLGLLVILVLILLSAGLVDIYRLYAARNWAYSVAQEAALAGASKGRDWNTLATTGEIRINETIATSQAEWIVASEMETRHISGYTLDIQVFPDPGGGTIHSYPPRPVRLGTGKGDWNTTEPAVGVYLAVPVDWLMLDTFGIVEKSVSVFASAGVVQ
jgi:hypothetical protein